jgi:hypothetical protein
MKKYFAAIMITLIVTLVSSGNLYAFDEAAKKLFDDGQYDECIQKIESLPNFKKQISNVMLLTFSNFQLYNFTKQKLYNNEYNAYYELLLAKTGVDDLNSILFFVNSSDKPEVVKSARKLLKDIFKNLHKIEDIVKLLPFASSSDKDVREYAFDSIQRIMEPIRAIVKDGGTMRPIDVRYFQNKDVINIAIENINLSIAQKILILIEEPAVEYLNNSKSTGSLKVYEKINSDIKDRMKKYPNSNWYSATGKQIKSP